MGLFALFRRDHPAAPSAHLLGELEAQGFGRPVRLAGARHEALVFGKLNGVPPCVVQRTDGSFAACTGTLFFRGQGGVEALSALLDGFDGGSFPWAECRGHYAVLLGRGGRLWLANDALGAYKVYHSPDHGLVSSSFIVPHRSVPALSLDPQGAYEYAWNGAVFGDKTLFREIRMWRFGQMVELGEGPARVLARAPLAPAAAEGPADFEATVERYACRLRALFGVYARNGGRFRSALSGGFDSRLMLALLLEAGLDPQLFVYGDAGDDDVRIAQAIATAEGLALEHVDKARLGDGDPAENAVRAYFVFDGWKTDGLFDDGADALDRLQRAAGDTAVLNGSLGEVFRNFFYLPQRDGYRLRDLVWSFYSRYAPEACTGAFSVARYEDAMVDDLRQAIGADDRPLARVQVEALYPLHRGRYWTGRDVGLNQRFGRTLFPFMEAEVFAGTAAVPIRYKDHGRLEARLIGSAHPGLARHPTSYGFAPAEPAPLRYRLKMATTLLRPAWLRRYSYRVQQRLSRLAPPHGLDAEALRSVVDLRLPTMRALFVPERVRDPDVFNRICTLELLCQMR